MIADPKKFHPSVQSQKVFNLSDYLLFALLTVVSSAAIVYFMTRWFAYGDWFARPLAFWGLTLIVISRLAINQFRWWCLPFMRKPVPMTPRPGWKVGVATTFVPGAESIEMLEETIRALVALNYPHDTWVLDEGNDTRVISLCTELGVFHFSRKNFPHYQTENGTFRARSKHGNYNAWLHEVGFERYEIIAAFDPDHVPEPAFLSEVLGYFNDPQVGYVQAAQAYYNQQASFIARGAAEETYSRETIGQGTYHQLYAWILLPPGDNCNHRSFSYDLYACDGISTQSIELSYFSRLRFVVGNVGALPVLPSEILP